MIIMIIVGSIILIYLFIFKFIPFMNEEDEKAKAEYREILKSRGEVLTRVWEKERAREREEDNRKRFADRNEDEYKRWKEENGR